MTKERLTTIAENLINHLAEALGKSNEDELYGILSNCIGMTDNEIDQLSGNFEDDREGFEDGIELPWDYGQKETVLEADLYLESEELVDFDHKTGNIKVDKQIFDDYRENAYINIRFVDDCDDADVNQYKMISETDEYIEMEFIG